MSFCAMKVNSEGHSIVNLKLCGETFGSVLLSKHLLEEVLDFKLAYSCSAFIQVEIQSLTKVTVQKAL